jgi:putative NADH-flavin reductase
MSILVLGATGKTGMHAVEQLLKQNAEVKALVRNADKLSFLKSNPNLHILTGNVLNMNQEQLKEVLTGVETVISCLGHNLNMKGIYGKPHYLVRDSIKKILEAGKTTGVKKFILMNTTGCINVKEGETYTKAEKTAMKVMTALLPPQQDNERALAFLMQNYPQEKGGIEWTAVRPDTLIQDTAVSPYSVHKTVQRSPIFNSGKVSRINVGNFISKLALDKDLWNTWKYKTPVLYNEE